MASAEGEPGKHWVGGLARGASEPECGGGRHQDCRRDQRYIAQPSMRTFCFDNRFCSRAEGREVLEVERKITRGLEAQPRLFFQAVTHNAFERGHHVESAVAEFWWVLFQDGIHSLDTAVALERT